MRLKNLSFSLLVALPLIFGVNSCSHPTTQVAEQFHYHDDGIAKPRVAMVPVYDHTKAPMPWNLSQELTEAFEERLFLAGRFYMTTDFDMLGIHKLPLQEINPFLDDIAWLGEVQTGTEFLVFIELVQHQLHENSDGFRFLRGKLFQSHMLDMAVRVKVIDLRNQKPKVILQQMVQDQYYIPWKFSSLNYEKGGWSKTAFSFSPIGVAHGKMVKRVTKQIEDYILLAKRH